MDEKISNLRAFFLKRQSLGIDSDDEILKELDELLYLLNKSESNIIRQKMANLSYALHEIGSPSVPYLLMLMFNKLEAVRYKPAIKGIRVDSISPIDENSFMEFFVRCFEHCKEGIRVFSFTIPPLEEQHEKDIYCNNRGLLDRFVMEPINTEELSADIPPRAICLGISKVLSHKFECQYEFYIQFSSILARMNRDGLYQEARDFAEEAFLCAYDYSELYYGFYVKFALYSSQKNIIDSLLNCCLLLTSLCEEDKVCDELSKKVYIEIFLMLRTFNFFEYAKNFYKKYIININLNEYDRQKIDLAMLYLEVMEGDSVAVANADRYIRINKKSIEKFGKSSFVPWFAFICNVKTLFPGEYDNSKNIIEFERDIAKFIPSDEADTIKNLVLKDRLGGKKSLINGLKNISRTRNKADLIHEVNQLLVTANRVIETSIKSGDIEGVLLGHQLKSDGSVYLKDIFFNPKDGVIQQTFDLSNANSARFDSYIEYVKNSLSGKESTQFVWIGFESNKLYCVIFESGEFIFCDYIKSLNKVDINDWIKCQLPKLAFEDTPNTGSPFVTREDYWKQELRAILASLPYFNIPLSTKDVVLFCDVEFSSFPHNMIKSNGNIMILDRGVSSPLSFDNYLTYKDTKVSTKDIYAWAPIVEGDIAISIAFSKLKEEMIVNNVFYDDNLMPSPNQEINIFISHGGRKGSSGFCGLYPSTGKAYDTDGIFGFGKIAILFVCHAGCIVENIYSSSTHTLVKKLLQSGYEAVVSPSWSLNVSIPGVWTKIFIENINLGFNISESVHKANLHVSKIFVSPSASGAMHLFGNGTLTCYQ